MRQVVTKTSAVEKAARLARDGALDAALKQYGDLFAMYPSDWGVANALGDLYARLGRTADAVAHFVRVAEQLDADGYTAKARAVYRKVLRLQPGHELAQVRVVELETRHLETGVVVNRAIAAAREEFASTREQRDQNSGAGVEQTPASAPLPLIPLPVVPAPGAVNESAPAEQLERLPDPNKVLPPIGVPGFGPQYPAGERWPTTRELSLAGAATPPATAGSPTFEELLDRLDPDGAAPVPNLEQALDSLDPVVPAEAARHGEETLDEMDLDPAYTDARALDLPALEALAPASSEEMDAGGDAVEPGAFRGESFEEYDAVTIEEGDCATDMTALRLGDIYGEAIDVDLDASEPFEPGHGAPAGEDDEHDVCEYAALEQDAVAAFAENQGEEEDPAAGECGAYRLEGEGAGEDAFALDVCDRDSGELADLLRALAEQARAGGLPPLLAGVSAPPLDWPLPEELTEPEGEDATEYGEATTFELDGGAELVAADVEGTFDEGETGADPVELELGGDAETDEARIEAAGVALGGAYHQELADPDPDFAVDAGGNAVEPDTDPVHAGDPDQPAAATVAFTGPAAVEEPFDASELGWDDEPALAGQLSVPVTGASTAAPDEGFEEIRITMLDSIAESIREGLARADDYIAAGELAKASALLQDAMCAVPLRHAACVRLARVYRDNGDVTSAMECLEWAAQREPADEAAGHDLAYELALTLEAMGQRDHALGIYRELLSAVGPGFRDVAARASHLAA